MAQSTNSNIKQGGFYRIKEVLNLIPISSTSWYDGIASGRYPKPVKLSERTSAWRVADIHTLIDELGAQA